MAIVNAEPFCIFLEINCDFVLVALPVEPFMSDSSVSFEMRRHVSRDGLRNLWYFLRGFLCRLLLLALLTGKAQQWTLECFGDEVSGDAILSDAGSR